MLRKGILSELVDFLDPPSEPRELFGFPRFRFSSFSSCGASEVVILRRQSGCLPVNTFLLRALAPATKWVCIGPVFDVVVFQVSSSGQGGPPGHSQAAFQ